MRIVVGEAEQVRAVVDRVALAAEEQERRKPVGPPPGPRCTTPRIEPPLAIGAKAREVGEQPYPPLTAESELKA